MYYPSCVVVRFVPRRFEGCQLINLRLRRLGWVVAATLAVAAFLFGSFASGPPLTNTDRVNVLAQRFACPVCSGQSVAESDIPVSRKIRRQIASWVDEGRSDDYIRNQLVAAYGTVIDYNPESSGLAGLVWVLPVAAGGGAVTVLTLMLYRGRLLARREAAGVVGSDDRTAAGSGSDGELSTSTAAGVVGSDEHPDVEQQGIPVSSQSRGRVLAWVSAVLLVSVTAGLLLARMSGSRNVGDSITGSIRLTSRELIFKAQQQLQNGDNQGAIATYDKALKLQPSNPEALTYRGWLTALAGDEGTAVGYLEDAIEADPEFSDARLFRAIIALRSDDITRASDELAVFDQLDSHPYAEELISRYGLRARIAEARKVALLQAMENVYGNGSSPGSDGDESGVNAGLDTTSSRFDASGFRVADALATAEGLASQGSLLNAVKLLDWVLSSYPDDADVLVTKGWLLVRDRDTELIEHGIGYLDKALEVADDHPHGLVFSVLARLWRGGPTPDDMTKARAHLAAFDDLEEQPAELVHLIESEDLRTTLAGR